jgi:glycosyltransferase involved in cell wall biosynthesis
MKDTFSAVIIARNEARTIARCIKSLSRVTDDIVVIVDDRTNDDTVSIAESLGCRVYNKPWLGFSANKNLGASLAKYDWILCLDADEIIDDTIVSHLKKLNPQLDTVYLMNILTYIGEAVVKHSGWHPDWNIRLYNRTVMTWNNNAIHEKLILIDKSTAIEYQKINGIVHHYSFMDWKHMENKYDEYAKVRAKAWVKKTKKPIELKRWFGPGFRFFKTFILKKGFLDGRIGFLLAKQEYTMKLKEWKYYDQFISKT